MVLRGERLVFCADRLMSCSDQLIPSRRDSHSSGDHLAFGWKRLGFLADQLVLAKRHLGFRRWDLVFAS